MILSIIVPVYNVEQYVEQCIRSIFNQNIPHEKYEVIVVDDCTPDNSVAIVEKLQQEFPTLQLLRLPKNRKLGGARNAGLSVAKGDYVWFVDSDDCIKPNILVDVCSYLKDDIDFVHFNYQILENDVIKENEENFFTTSIITGNELFFDERLVWWRDCVVAWRKIYRRQFLIENKISFAENIMYEDNDYAFKVFSLATKVKHVSNYWYVYRNNPTSITRTALTYNHIYYFIDLCYRLNHLKNDMLKQDIDIRYQPILASFIKYKITECFTALQTMSIDDKKKSIKLLKKIDTSILCYLSLRNRILYKFGFFTFIP